MAMVQLQSGLLVPDKSDVGGAGAVPSGFVGGLKGPRGRRSPGYMGAFAWNLMEYNPNLAGLKAITTYDQMRKSDAQVRASLRMVKAPLLAAEYYVEAASPSPADRGVAEDVWWILNHMPGMNGMGRSFIKFLREAASFLDFGIYAFEQQWTTLEDWTPPSSSIRQRPRARAINALLDLAPRHPIRLQGFNYNEHGQVDSMVWGTQSATIDLDKLVLFSFDDEGDDPWGISILRSAYPHWYYKQSLYKFDGIQKEKMSIGIPDVELQPGFSAKDEETARELAANMRTNEQAFVVRPHTIKAGYIAPPNTTSNPLESAQHHGLMILQNVLVQFLALGTQESGSRAVSGSQTEAFLDALRYVGDLIREVVNTQLIANIVKFNWGPDTEPPILRIRHLRENDVWRSLSVAVRNLVEPGVITPNADMEVFFRRILELPPASQEVLDRGIEDRVKPMPPGAGAPNIAGQGTNSDGSRQGSRTGGPKE